MKLIVFSIFSLNLIASVIVGAENTNAYINLISNKNVALVVNQTSVVDSSYKKTTHLIDFLLSKNIKIKKLFALEHGIRGTHDAGEVVDSTIDSTTGLEIVSLYGKNKTIKEKDIKEIDTLIFDIQDIGVRFYTYISSLKYVLDACAKFKKHCIVLDRPNPYANIVSGPVLDLKLKSFVGMYPIPITYGLTIGELAKMIVGEGWSKKLKLDIIPVLNWKRSDVYNLSIKPSPNLPNKKSIELYPSLAPFEATDVSVGRGTYRPFTHIGHPSLNHYDYYFIPRSIEGMSKNPKHKDEKCYGIDLSHENSSQKRGFTLKYIFKVFNEFTSSNFFISKSFFNKLVGVEYVYNDLVSGKSYDEVEVKWNKDLEAYKLIRERYLIYD